MQRGRTHVLSFYNAYRERKTGDLYMDRLSTVIEQVAGQQGYDLLVHCNYRRSADEIYRFLNGGLCDGLIFYGPVDDDPLIDLLRASRLPIVLLDHADKDNVLSAVYDDWRDGMRQITERLIALGHRRIGAIEGFPGSDGPLRIGALRAELEQRGLTLPSERVETSYAGFRTPDEALARLLALPEPPTAVFCWHDRLGYEVLESCDRLGVRVPRDLSLIGYDGIHWPSTSSHILASVVVPLEAVSTAAVRMLDDLIEGRRERPVQESYPVVLSEGTTLASLPEGRR
jgi:DNA-binding LacI/PurR family transcriptional regulator